MNVVKKCLFCGNEYVIPHWRIAKSKFCSRECSDKSKLANGNTVCTNCGKSFHMKDSAKRRYNRKIGFFCSKDCLSQYRKEYFKGANNHQYGKKGHLNKSFIGKERTKINKKCIETYVYSPNRIDADRSGRVLKHRLIAEENWMLFDPNAFYEKDGQYVLKKGYVVHHKDGNHNNNEISNLDVLTRSQHTILHNKNYMNIRHNKTGRIIKRVPVELSDNDMEVKYESWIN